MTSSSSSTRSNWYSCYRGFIQGKTRLAAGWIFAILIGLSAKDFPTLPGILVCFVGASLRFWASGYLRKDSRPAVGGPYAYVRNPLYLGTYLMAVGVTWATENLILLGIITILFAAIYHYIILDEETKLQSLFGEAYSKYKQAVPRFFPRLWPPVYPAARSTLFEINPETTHHGFSWDLAMKNKAYEAYAAFAGLIGYIALAAWLWNRFGN